ncbi:hypothetical protein LguiA_029371 [Lonicera macranthoides]
MGLQNISMSPEYLEVLTDQLQRDLMLLDVRVQFNLLSNFWFSSLFSREMNDMCTIKLHTDDRFRNKSCP